MLIFLITLMAFYTLYKLILSALQIKFVRENLGRKAVILDQIEYEKAGYAAIINEKFEIFSNLYSFFIFLFWIFFGLGTLASLFDTNKITSGAFFVLSYIIIGAIFALPLSVYETFVKDKKLGFSNTTAKIFITDSIKSLILTLIFGFLLIFLLISCFEFLGKFWWIVGFLLSFVVILGVNLIYPTLIAPLFNKMSPLENGELKSQIEAILARAGFKSSGVFIIDASRRDTRLNAYFGGFGATKRVVLFDTLIKKLSIDEILAVLGHELGHFKHGDIFKNLVLMFFVLFSLFAVFGNIPASVFEALNLEQNGATTMLILLMFSPILSAIFQPIISYFSRAHEFGADEFGADIKNTTQMISALKKLGTQNLAFPIAHPIYSAVYHSHPTLFERIKELENRSDFKPSAQTENLDEN